MLLDLRVLMIKTGNPAFWISFPVYHLHIRRVPDLPYIRRTTHVTPLVSIQRKLQIERNKEILNKKKKNRSFTKHINHYSVKNHNMPYSKAGTFYKYMNPASPKVIIFFHGLGSSLNYYYPIAYILSKQYGCLLLDNPGAGRSKLKEESVSVKEIGTTGLLVIEELEITDKEFVLVGHSMSGMVINYLAANHADELNIAACVLISPVHPLPSTKPAFEKRIELIKSTHSMEEVAEAVSANAPGSKCSAFKRAFIRELASGLTPAGYIANCGAILSACSHEEEFKKLYKKINVPVLFVLGSEDKTTPFKGNVEFIAEELKDKRIVTLEGIGHWAALEDDEKVLSILKDFFNEICY